MTKKGRVQFLIPIKNDEMHPSLFIVAAVVGCALVSGLARMEASRAAQIACVEPATAAVLGVVLFSQALSAPELAGIALILGSVLAMNTGSKRG